MPTDVHYQPRFVAGMIAALRMGIPVFAGDPAVINNGDIWVDSDAQLFKFRVAGGTVSLGAGLSTEAVQDIIGALLADSTTLDFSYDDSGAVESAEVKDNAITFAKMQDIATARIIGRVTAGNGDPELLTPAQTKVLLAFVAADIADFVATVRTSISATDTATLDLTYNNATGVLSGTVLDAPSVGGQTAAQIINSAVATVVGGASAAYDTLVEIQALLQADDTALAGLTAAVSARARFFAADLAGGAAAENVAHGLGLAVGGDYTARVFVKATGVEELYAIAPTAGNLANSLTVTDETGGNIPAGRRIFITAGA